MDPFHHPDGPEFLEALFVDEVDDFDGALGASGGGGSPHFAKTTTAEKFH
jgi:hypothetical protein